VERVQLSVICIKWWPKDREEIRVLREVEYMMMSRGLRTALWNATKGSMKGREVVITFNTKAVR